MCEPLMNGGVDMLELETVRLARQGDREAFARLYDDVAVDLYKVALYTLGNPHDAEDVVSETFIEAFKGIRNLRDENSYKRWMLTILSARCKRRIGGYIKERQTVDIDEMLDLPAEAGAPAEAGLAERVTVMDALAALTEQERLIVTCSVLQGYTTKEIATMLHMPHGTVSSKLHRTLKKMRAAIE